MPSNTTSDAYTTQYGEDDYEDSLARDPPIPRKQVVTSTNAGYQSAQQVSAPTAYSGRYQGNSNALSEAPSTASDGIGSGRNEVPSQSTSVLDRSRPISSKGVTGPQSAQDVVNRAKSNTYDTEVIEKVAPGESLPKDTADIFKS